MRHEIDMLLHPFSICTHENAGNNICHDISGVDNDDFVTILVKRVTSLLKCYDQYLGVCDKPLFITLLLENGVLSPKYACLKLYITQITVATRYTRCSVFQIFLIL